MRGILLTLSSILSTFFQMASLKKFELATVPNLSWQTKTELLRAKSSSICASFAAKHNEDFFFAFDAELETCSTGKADFSQLGTGDREVWMDTSVDKFALIHGNKAGDVDFDVLLPNGNICPSSHNGLPDFDREGRYSHGIAVLEGVIYMFGGKLASGGSLTDESFNLDLNSPTPSWTPIAGLPRPAFLAVGGAVPHVNSVNGRRYVYVFVDSLCESPTGPSDGFVWQYDVGANSWSDVGRAQLRRYYGGVAVSGNFAYIAGGQSCDGWYSPQQHIGRFDMDDPMLGEVRMDHGLCAGIGSETKTLGCSVVNLRGGAGLMCVGGEGPDSDTGRYMTSNVQFIPLDDEGLTSGDCQMWTAMPAAKSKPAVFSLGMDRIAVYGGYDSYPYQPSPTIFVWDPKKQEFVDSGLVIAKEDLSEPAVAYIDMKYIGGPCWQYL